MEFKTELQPIKATEAEAVSGGSRVGTVSLKADKSTKERAITPMFSATQVGGFEDQLSCEIYDTEYGLIYFECG